jgi:hypothetical protein
VAHGRLVKFFKTLGFTDVRFVLVKQDGEEGEAKQDAQASDANQNAVGGEFVDGDGHGGGKLDGGFVLCLNSGKERTAALGVRQGLG